MKSSLTGDIITRHVNEHGVYGFQWLPSFSAPSGLLVPVWFPQYNAAGSKEGSMSVGIKDPQGQWHVALRVLPVPDEPAAWSPVPPKPNFAGYLQAFREQTGITH